MKSLTEGEVRKLILIFWRLNAAKAPMADFVPILDDGFAIVAVDDKGDEIIRFDGLAGLEEHQYGKQIYYDQRFKLFSFDCDIDEGRAVAHTRGEWRARHCEPRMAESEQLRADVAHTWYARRRPEGAAVLTLHVCTHFNFQPGFAPATTAETTGREFHLDFDQYWSTSLSITGVQ
ncbi:MAG TPA: hypothetical protein VNG12_11665 [Acidimicrobiales bacterium]|nr:hypothetical protein [Acidimicrobiales bacterium]